MLVFGALIGRLYYLQLIKASILIEESRISRVGAKFLLPVRGLILDRNFGVLACNKKRYTVGVDKTQTPDILDSITRLCKWLGKKDEEMARHLAALESDKIVSRVIQRELSEDEKDQLESQHIPGVHFEEQAIRFYPEGSLASHLVGYTGTGQKGLSGIEFVLDYRLQGSRESVSVDKDIHRNLLSEWDYNKIVSNHGADVVLTIDGYIQHVVERELRKVREEVDAQYANAVVFHPKTGEILALANYPTFDPNQWDAYPDRLRQNRMLTDVYEPGSIMKPFTVIAALDKQVVTPETVFYCEEGQYHVYGKIIRDDIHSFTNLTVRDILVRSSNIGAVKIARRLGKSPDDFREQAKILYDYLRRFGFKNVGDPNTTIIPGESGGVLRPPERWQPASIGAVPFGQEIATNTLILAAAYGAIANRGIYQPPELIKGYRTADGIFYPVEPKPSTRVVETSVIEQVVSMLVDVTEDPEGNGYRVRIPGFHIAGKTGTAQKHDPAGGGYAKGLRVASFAGFFPAEDPQVVIVVMVDEPRKKKYGSEVAGPARETLSAESISSLGLSPPAKNIPF